MLAFSENLDREASEAKRDTIAMLVAAEASHQIDSEASAIGSLSSALALGHRAVKAAGSVIASLQIAISETGPDMMCMTRIAALT